MHGEGLWGVRVPQRVGGAGYARCLCRPLLPPYDLPPPLPPILTTSPPPSHPSDLHRLPFRSRTTALWAETKEENSSALLFWQSQGFMQGSRQMKEGSAYLILTHHLPKAKAKKPKGKTGKGFGSPPPPRLPATTAALRPGPGDPRQVPALPSSPRARHNPHQQLQAWHGHALQQHGCRVQLHRCNSPFLAAGGL